ELKERMETILQRLQAQYNQLPPEDVLQKQILEQLIVERMQLQMAKRYDIKPSVAEIDQAIDRIAHNNQMTPEQLKADIERQNMTIEDLRSQIRAEMTINQLQQGVV